jgi:hypothetical protein
MQTAQSLAFAIFEPTLHCYALCAVKMSSEKKMQSHAAIEAVMPKTDFPMH